MRANRLIGFPSAVLLAAMTWAAASATQAQPSTPKAPGSSPSSSAFKVMLLVPADDARLERSRLERGLPGHASGPAVDALRMALKDSEVALLNSGIRMGVEVVEVADAAAAKSAAARLSSNPSVLMVVTDLEASATRAVAETTSLPVLNIGASDDELRQSHCRPNLWHVLPSDRMRADALAQALVARKWNRVLLLVPQGAADAARVAAAQGAIKRYGLKLVDTRSFKLSADPRERDLANPRLLTQGDYDVVWVVDSDGEFSTSLPYRTVLARPVVGDGGLVAVAWSSKFERFGGPQVSRRLKRTADRPMGSHDWSAWMAGKAAAALADRVKADGTQVDRSQRLATLELDGSKGVSLSFRSWDGQLRQPMLLTDGQTVIETVPGDGVMHPRNRLDSLGADAPEKLCKARGG